MSGARLRLILAALAFAGWLGWLGYAVLQRNNAPVLSRAQLTAATHLLVAEITVGEDGRPEPRVKVVEVLRGDNVDKANPLEVSHLESARPPGSDGLPSAGTYLLPVVRTGTGYRIAGLPRSPGYEAVDKPVLPAIYPWNDATRAQLKALELLPR